MIIVVRDEVRVGAVPLVCPALRTQQAKHPPKPFTQTYYNRDVMWTAGRISSTWLFLFL